MKHLCTELLQTMLARVKDLRCIEEQTRNKLGTEWSRTRWPLLLQSSGRARRYCPDASKCRACQAPLISLSFSNQTEALEKPPANERAGCIEN